MRGYPQWLSGSGIVYMFTVFRTNGSAITGQPTHASSSLIFSAIKGHLRVWG